MTGAELSATWIEEFYQRERFTVAVRENDFDQWRGWMEGLIKAASAPPLLFQLWNDNEDTLAAINRSSFNRLKKMRNARFKDWAMEIPLEWQDTPKPQPDMLEGEDK